MSDDTRNPKVDRFIGNAKQWQAEYQALRHILNLDGLHEDFKWGKPCYSVDGKNVVLMHGFKDYCALLFMKGALLNDPAGILISQTENVQSARQLRFTSADEIKAMAGTIKTYILDAIAVEKSGAAVEFKQTEDFVVAEEFQTILDEDQNIRSAFEALTPGRQRGYLLHFSSAKQSKTRAARVEKCLPLILDGLGLND